MDINVEFRKSIEDAVSFQSASDILKDMLSGIDEKDEDAMDMWRTLQEKCVRYASIRSKWSGLSNEEKMDIDDQRTSAHNSVITNFNMLARYQKAAGFDASWRERLGDNRKDVGDFACYISLYLALAAR